MTKDNVTEVTPAYPVGADLSALPEVMREAAGAMLVRSDGDGVMERRITEIMASDGDDVLASEPVPFEDVVVYPRGVTIEDFSLHQGDKMDPNGNPTIYAAMVLSGVSQDGEPWRVITTCGGKVLLAQLIKLKSKNRLPKVVKFRADDTSAGNTVYSLVDPEPKHPFGDRW